MTDHRPPSPPVARWGEMWDELQGYVQQAKADGSSIDPDDLLPYLNELRRRALAPVLAWVKESR